MFARIANPGDLGEGNAGPEPVAAGELFDKLDVDDGPKYPTVDCPACGSADRLTDWFLKSETKAASSSVASSTILPIASMPNKLDTDVPSLVLVEVMGTL